jgi:hypothetical protein
MCGICGELKLDSGSADLDTETRGWRLGAYPKRRKISRR